MLGIDTRKREEGRGKKEEKFSYLVEVRKREEGKRKKEKGRRI